MATESPVFATNCLRAPDFVIFFHFSGLKSTDQARLSHKSQSNRCEEMRQELWTKKQLFIETMKQTFTADVKDFKEEDAKKDIYLAGVKGTTRIDINKYLDEVCGDKPQAQVILFGALSRVCNPDVLDSLCQRNAICISWDLWKINKEMHNDREWKRLELTDSAGVMNVRNAGKLRVIKAISTGDLAWRLQQRLRAVQVGRVPRWAPPEAYS